MHIKNREKLLQDIVDGLKELERAEPHASVNLVIVTFYVSDPDHRSCGKEVLRTNLSTALGYIVNDIYFDEESNWQDADHARLHTI